ncbi:MAG: hypothetical protein EOO01_13775 [Chitinophagaceae bacterium]|nr:MAG: hypothetical protein EOO01_13775 [Chitinophagaceae bacterium]
MNRRKEILDELIDAAPNVAGIDNQHPYWVPPGYFDKLPQMILLRIKTENAGSVRDEMDLISPLLGGLSKKMPFSTPVGYFESLAPQVTSSDKSEPARVVKMFQPRRTFRLAAAAVTVGIIGLASWMFFKPVQTELAVKPDTEVQGDITNKVNQLSENELANFVESASIFAPYDNNSTSELNADDVMLMLADIPDTELEKYVDQHSVKEKFN